MATEIVSSIGSGAGRDYSTPSAWEADTDVDLVAVDERHIGELHADSDYSEQVVITGAITDVSAGVYRHLTVAAGERHQGVPGGGAVVRWNLANSPITALFVPREEGVRVSWIEVTGTFDSTSAAQCVFAPRNSSVGSNDGDKVSIHNCLLHDLENVGTGWLLGIRCSVATDGVSNPVLRFAFANNVIYNLVAAGGTADGIHAESSENNQEIHLYNNTIHNCQDSAYHIGGDEHISAPEGAGYFLYNNIGFGSGLDDFEFSTGANLVASHNSASSDQTADDKGGTGHLLDRVPGDEFVDLAAGSEDLHLQAAATCVDAGENLCGGPRETTFPWIVLDIDGEDRCAIGDAWDVGADLFVLENAPPDKPTLTVDEARETGAALSSSAFSDPDGDPHDASRWQIIRSGGSFTSPFYDSGWTAADLVAHEVVDGTLSSGSSWEARVAHRDPAGSFTWSDPVAFQTGTLPALSSVEGLFFGQSGGSNLWQFGGHHRDLSAPITARLQAVPLAPGGVGGEALFHNLYVALEWQSEGTVDVTPVLDGDRRTDLTRTVNLSEQAEPTRDRFEVPLVEGYDPGGGEVLRQALRGTWFQAEIEVTLLSPTEHGIVVEGVELEQEIVRESHPAVSYTVEALENVDHEQAVPWYVGAGGELLEGDQGLTDDGQTITARIQTSEVAPAGPGGEAVFHNAYLAITRSNAVDATVVLTPIVDGELQTARNLTLAGVAGPVTEVLEVPLMEAYDPGSGEAFRYAPRGVYFGLRLESDVPDGVIVFEGVELERELVRESEAPVAG